MIFSGDRFHYNKDIFRNGNILPACFVSLYDTHFLELLNVPQNMCVGHTNVLYMYQVWQLNISGFGISEMDPLYVSNECGMTNILFQIVNTILSQVYSNLPVHLS